MKLFPSFKPSLIYFLEFRGTIYRTLPSKQINWKHDMESYKNAQRPEEKLEEMRFILS